MSDTPLSAATETAYPTDLTQTDTNSSRMSRAESHTAPTDQPSAQTAETVSSNVDYEELELPEVLKGNEANFTSFKKLAAELKLPAETVKKLIDWEAQTAQAGIETADGTRSDILQKWTEQTKSVFGQQYSQAVARALSAAERFGGPELRELLDVTGLGNHPVMVKTFHAISQQISEDESVAGRLRHSTDKTFAEALYGKAD